MSRFARCVVLANGLNAIDVVLTLVLTRGLGFVEMNPLMERLLLHSPLSFVLAKLTIVASFCAVLHRMKKARPERADFALGVVVGMLSMICFWQTWMLMLTVGVI